mgnify:CR=1 FL=1
MLITQQDSCVILIDVQAKLTPLVQNAQEITGRCAWVLQLAKSLNIPRLICEQYPQGLGKTIEDLQGFGDPIPKVHFSCWKNPTFQKKIHELGRKQCILIGIETHVCVLQTALDLCEDGYSVFIVVDAVSSRNANDHRYGLKRMKQAGAQLITAEMLFFEWLEQAGTDSFKILSKLFLN